ncbi:MULTISPECIES: Mur ligase family protein [Kordiimonas]|jgi:UDP-N-acetylmuramoyl-tripeptide--D-alanyl-D-alanine ligase|uniref:Mur ligase family protein n=1 Tax=Kordiimonas TaxID=288021 RepID=UPI00257C09FB|nr:UDP-N-acetylmuramoyl-tripeptide--D-alanyl-D-alanine ligase [Kordiimonas sp. UBA4487]
MTDAILPFLWPALAAITALYFAHERGLALMMFFQQEEYDGPRFFTWLQENKAYDRRTSVWLMGAILAGIVPHLPILSEMEAVATILLAFGWVPIFLGFGHGVLRSRAIRKQSKKPLVVTARVKRILTVYLGLAAALLVLVVLAAQLAPQGTNYALQLDRSGFGFVAMTFNWEAVLLAALLVVFVQTIPVLLVFANKLLEPAEERVKAKFRQEAVDKFAELQPKVIAITGSFGKTSTKHILNHILAAAAPTLATPGSVNTDMGITRVIREQLKPDHQFFIVEMGAYGPGSIARLCTLTPPDVSLITAVGAAHYERFKSLETVARAKFEIAEAAFARGGKVVVNCAGIEDRLLDERMAAVKGPYTLVGKGRDVSFDGFDATKEGLVVHVTEGGKKHALKAPLYGRHQAGNIALAAATARALGLPWAAIKGALASMPQIRHRLEVSHSAGQPTLINDAYNSNPVGFAAALETLDVLVEENGRRILVTPGMVELGDKHEEEHAQLGGLAAKHCDIVAVVTPDRIPTFVKALEKANDGSVTVMTFAKQEDAETWVRSHWKAGDAVLFENNLPDLYEAKVSF